MGHHQSNLFSPHLSEQEALARIRLVRSRSVGPLTFYALMRRFGTAVRALERAPMLAQQSTGRSSFTPFSLEETLREVEAVRKHGARFLFHDDPSYPPLLATLPDAPPVLTLKGRGIGLTHPKIIGIVGARNASLPGRKFAEKIARDLGERGYIIVSGLARGIDTHAHEGALNTGTLAVVAGGVDQVYPLENARLQKAIEDNGCVLGESPYGVPPQGALFPKRNRLISGLSLGVLVVEAAYRSGSLVTARYALEQNRDVWAVPGSPFDPRCQGTNALIRQGASLIQNTEDLLECLEGPLGQIHKDYKDHKIQIQDLGENCNDLFDPGESGNSRDLEDSQDLEHPRNSRDPLDSLDSLDAETPLCGSLENCSNLREHLLTNLSYTPLSVDEVLRVSERFPKPEVLSVLLGLELAGTLQRYSGNRIALTGNDG